ncbi:helix-turn-helix domain-containing protein [Brevibacillus laterosporus]|uniref:helix-turn-helix domain-containing protein n=1 Tax=Brevibacillus laterosporus TaxID=1465 RepID=UPI000E6B8A55|nr:helix-turn-helix transcriptional regulator [Brevibacillus laterosporus]AYB39711.1 XRE family transcriptional regulator [Brevibacillus laterosporus]MBM7109140.1 helix-turn-helix protein [Brevibacillus laterosporus]
MIPVHLRIEEVRKRKGITKSSLAKKIGISPMGYHYLSIGRNPISTDRLQIIAKELNTDPRDFLRPKLNESFIK